jgi:hypothetical protein
MINFDHNRIAIGLGFTVTVNLFWNVRRVV